MNLEDRQRRGMEAARVIEHDLYREAWEAVRAEMLRRIEDAGPHDTDRVMAAKAVLSGAREARQYLERIMKDGQMASAELADNQRAKKARQ